MLVPVEIRHKPVQPDLPDGHGPRSGHLRGQSRNVIRFVPVQVYRVQPQGWMQLGIGGAQPEQCRPGGALHCRHQ